MGNIKVSFIVKNIIRIGILIVSSIVIFSAIKNTVEWSVEKLGGESKDIWKNAWQRCLDIFGENEFMLFVAGSMGFGALIFWAYNSIYIFMDMTEKPQFLRKYKIQEGKNSPLTWKQLKNALGVIIPSQSIGIPMTALFYPIQKWRGIPHAASELPSVTRLVLEVSTVALIQGAMFYYTHRLLHHPKLYKRIHKVHHEWTAPVSITAVYAHPIEAVISNYIPILLASTLVGCHLATTWLWYVVAIVQTANDHSGYHFPFSLSTEFHDYHHLKFNQCFGVFGILDHLHGTDDQFRETKQSQRHKMFFNLAPMSKVIPDDKPKMSERPKAA